MVVQDPAFWRRFSVAVHQDDATKEDQKGPDLKHSYVSSPFAVSTPTLDLASPTSQTHFVITPLNSASSLPQQIQSPAPLVHAKDKHPSSPTTTSKPPKRQPSKLRKSPSTRSSTAPLLSPPPRPPPKEPLPKPRKAVHYAVVTEKRKSLPQNPLTPVRYSLRCPSTLSLTGRSKSHFRTWTTITGNADNKNRESWLASQNKKLKQRTWICWAFWLGLIALVAGVVAAVLVLKAHKII